MKVLFTAVNARFIHSALAPRYLAACCMDTGAQIKVMEFTINDEIGRAVAEIYHEKAQIIAFSCYIWNVEMVLHMAQVLKKISPRTVIVLGGPEVSYDAGLLMESHPYVDFVVSGEGELAVKMLIKSLIRNPDGVPVREEMQAIRGLAYREGNRVVCNGTAEPVKDLDSIPSPYEGELLQGMENKIAYLETSRGCPFSCNYCLSSATRGVRHFSLDRVRTEIKKLVSAGVRQIKFVDRTFNCSRDRAMEIFRYILSLDVKINFHFEAAADLFDDEMIAFLQTIPPGLFQFEIGVQSVNPKTLEMIHRRTDLNRLMENVEKLREGGNMHLHLDLIAGLPGEDLASFRKSFDTVYRLRPDQLQLGFLKLLKGSGIRETASEFGYVFDDRPPYEVLGNAMLGFEELQLIKGIEELVESYYNSGKFIYSLRYLIGCYSGLDRHTDAGSEDGGSFDFYRRFSRFWRGKGLFAVSHSSRRLYEILISFGRSILKDEKMEMFKALVKFDYLSGERSGRLPEGLESAEIPGFKEECFMFLKEERNLEAYLPGYAGIPSKQIIKQVHFEVFSYDLYDFIKSEKYCLKNHKTVVLFDYSRRDAVTGRFDAQKIIM